jgi:hypothetical protein
VERQIITKTVCECSDESCSCKGKCTLPPTRFVKIVVFEALCTGCAGYALNSYDGAREIEPVDERWARFAKRHPYLAPFLKHFVFGFWWTLIRG